MAGYNFILPPLNQLTVSQQGALIPTEPIALSGGPGTGKSVVSIYRHINKIEQGKDCMLLTFSNSLKYYLKNCCRQHSRAAADRIYSTYEWYNKQDHWCEELIIDEAQDVLLKVYESFKETSLAVSYSADDSQSLYPDSHTSVRQLAELFPQNHPYLLTRNFRSTKAILSLVRFLFKNANISLQDIEECKSEGDKPILYLNDGDVYRSDDRSQDRYVLNIVESFADDPAQNIAVLCPWRTHVKRFYTIIHARFPQCTYYCSNQGNCTDIGNIHVTTFKSAKGLEFDTVIIPYANLIFECLENKRLCQYNIEWKDFFVAMTRCKTNLRLLSEPDIKWGLLKEYVDIVS